MRAHRLLVVLILAAGGLTVARPAVAASRTVPSGAFPTIQSAENASVAGDVINIKPGVYNENVVVDVADLTIQKKPKTDGEVIVDGFNAAVDQEVFDVDANRFTLKNVTVRNGESENVECDGSDCAFLGVTFKSSLLGLDCLNIVGANAKVVRSRFFSCSDDGMSIDGAGARVSANRIASVDRGIELIGAGGIISKNTVVDSEDGSIFVDGANPVINANKIVSGDSDAIEVICAAACSDGEIRGNTIKSEDDEAIDVDIGAAGFLITKNTATNTNGTGFAIVMSNGEVSRNSVVRSGAEGGDGIRIEGNGNTIRFNTSTLSDRSGIVVIGGSDNNLIFKNVAINNGGDGIRVNSLGIGNTLDRNTANRNSADGIENDGFLTTATNNRAAKNKVDCTNDGTFAAGSPSGNNCADNSNFLVPGTGID